jgi:hypothetical protein
MSHLWNANDPAHFWRCLPEIPPGEWLAAARQASPVLGLAQPWGDFDTLLELTLGEGQFGPDHWRLGRKKDIYYQIKPFLPRILTRLLRQLQARLDPSPFLLHWPIEERYVLFQWELIRCLLLMSGRSSIDFVRFWPQDKRFALILTHDAETASGQAHVRAVADLEESMGFRSLFNFVPERYEIDSGLLHELQARGFEVGVHGLHHDGKLYSSRPIFENRARSINHYLEDFQAAGFRSPCTMRQPEWMQTLAMQYDLSFFDTDPYEPIPGGTMSIWPFMLGNFVEMPYTLVQDYTLIKVLKQSKPRVWLEKVDFIRRYHGMALINTHPDYLRDKTVWAVYRDFLTAMRDLENDWWHSLPKEAAAWWRKRQSAPLADSDLDIGQITPIPDGIELC